MSDGEADTDMNFLVGLGNSLEWGIENNGSVKTEHKFLKKRMSSLDLNELYEKCNYLNEMMEMNNRYVQFHIISRKRKVIKYCI